MKMIKPTLACILFMVTPQAAISGQLSGSLSCGFINKTAYNNEADCQFSDRAHSSATITPHRKISPTKAAQWLVAASSALQLGGESNFETITVFTSPDATGPYVEAKSSAYSNVRQEPRVVKSLIKVCTLPNDWSAIIGKDGKPAAEPKCHPLR